MSLLIVVAPQIVVGCGLLIWQLGYSALAGIAVSPSHLSSHFADNRSSQFLHHFKVSFYYELTDLNLWLTFTALLFGQVYRNRHKHQKVMDKRVRLLTEIINHIRQIKFYAYESLFRRKIEVRRDEEMKILRALTACQSLGASMMYFIPTLAAICEFYCLFLRKELIHSATFIVYSATGNTLDPGKIFTSLQIFNILRQPIAWFPRLFLSFADFKSAACKLLKLSYRVKSWYL